MRIPPFDPAASQTFRLFEAIWRSIPRSPFDWLVQRPAQAALLAGTVTFVAAATTGGILGIPQPSIHDEFAYLLQGDTFATGRLTNPTPPAWTRFETFHVLLVPTYSGKYPPAFSLLLSLGQLLGHPIIGVWLGAGFMIGSITWMLLGWIPSRWAILGGFLAWLQWGLVGYWTQSYWGGSVAAAAGALLYGAAIRAKRDPRVADGVLIGLGLGILANSRPYEGLIASLPVFGILVFALIDGDRRSKGEMFRRVVIPASLVVLMAGLWTCQYNERVTGDPLMFPHQLYREQYATTPVFRWHPVREDLEYRHESLSRFWHEWSMRRYRRTEGLRGFVTSIARRAEDTIVFFLGPAFLLAVLMPLLMRERRFVFASASVLLVIGANWLSVWFQPHYLAPVTSLFILISTLGLMTLARVRTGWIVGRHWALIMVALFVVHFADGVSRLQDQNHDGFPATRERVKELLHDLPGDDLVIVQYGPGHNVHEEWVYNAADLPSSGIIWARDMGPAKNRELIEIYPNREAWKLVVEGSRPLLTRFP